MTKNHDIFDSLAGALLLGEATDAERAQFAAHTGDCVQCAAEFPEYSSIGANANAIPTATTPLPILARIERVRESETWRPDVSDGVLRRVRARREGRIKVVLGALGGATAFSLVINFAMLSGAGARIGAALHPQDAVGIAHQMRDMPAFAALAAPAAPVTSELARALQTRRAAKERAERLAALKVNAERAEALKLDDAVDSRASARKLIPTDGVVVADPLAGTPLEAPLASAHVKHARHVAIEPVLVIPETLHH